MAARASPVRDGVHQSALSPQAVEPARQLERAAGADIALEYFAIVAGRLDGVEHPLVVHPEARAEFAGRSEQTLHSGVLTGLRLFVGVRRGHAKLLGLDQTVVHPRDEIRPGFVPIAR